MDLIESKIRQVLYRMVENKSSDHTKKVFLNALETVIQTQLQLGRIDDEGAIRLRDYVKILVAEHCGEDEGEEWNDEDIVGGSMV